MVGEEALNLMKPNAVLINTARGGIIDQKALVTALKEEKIRGAVLDVLETEPPQPDDELLRLDNVFLSPHAAFYSEESKRELKVRAAQVVVAALKGEAPRNLLNPEVLTSAARRW